MLAREREGQDVGWDEWVAYTTEIHTGNQGDPSQIWVSGCRLFWVVPDGEDEWDDVPYHLEIYDFSYAGRVKYLPTLDGADERGGARRISPSLDYELPWSSGDFSDPLLTTGHDSIVFWIVSILISLPPAHGQMKVFPCSSVQDQEPNQLVAPRKAALHVWSL